MLLGAEIRVHTDHKNLTHKLSSFTTQRVMRWRLLLEEYGPKFLYKEGESNVIADALSRVPTTRTEREKSLHGFDPHVTLSSTTPPSSSSSTSRTSPDADSNENPADTEKDMADIDNYYSIILDDVELADCLLVHPEFDEHKRNPFGYNTIRHYQQQCARTPGLIAANPNLYEMRTLGGVQLVCRRLPNNQFKIVLPDDMLPRLVTYFHRAMYHAEGTDRLIASISRHFYHPGIRAVCEDVIRRCKTCQRMKKSARQYAQLAPRDHLTLVPWREIHTDVIGPWKVKVNGHNLVFNALTTIDPVTCLLEIQRLPKANPTAQQAYTALDESWLSRHPKPDICLHDQGSEFIGHDFQIPMANRGITCKSIS